MTAAQLQEWITYFELEPWGGARDDYRSGLVAAAVVNAAPFRGKGAKAFTPSDFFPELSTKPRRAQTPADMLEVARAMTAGLGGTVGTISRE